MDMRSVLSYAEAGRMGAAITGKILKRKKEKRICDYRKNPKICLKCCQSLSYKKRKNKFCSHSCAAKHNNKGVRRNVKNKREKCLNCDVSLIGKSGKKYCSPACSGKHRHKLKKIEILSNPQNEYCPKTIRKILIEERNYRCESCGRKTWLGNPIPLEQDHIDGDYSNNTFDNLRLLCPNCHTLTPTYGIRNIGNGRDLRKNRRKRRPPKST